MSRRRPRLTAQERRERFAVTRDRWADSLPPELRAHFLEMLIQSDELVARGWELRVAAFGLARAHIEGRE